MCKAGRFRVVLAADDECEAAWKKRLGEDVCKA